MWKMGDAVARQSRKMLAMLVARGYAGPMTGTGNWPSC